MVGNLYYQFVFTKVLTPILALCSGDPGSWVPGSNEAALPVPDGRYVTEGINSAEVWAKAYEEIILWPISDCKSGLGLKCGPV